MRNETRDDKRSRALIVRPRGTQRILRPAEARSNPASRMAGGSRPSLSIGGGGGGRTFGGGGAAAVAAALASSAMPAMAGPEVFGPETITPFQPPPPTLPETIQPFQPPAGTLPEVLNNPIIPGLFPPPIQPAAQQDPLQDPRYGLASYGRMRY